MLYVTLNLLRANDACTDGYAKLVKHLGGPSFDHDAPIPLTAVLDSNGLEDALWCLRATTENCDCFARLLACDYAEEVLPLFEKVFPDDNRPRKAIEVARRFTKGEASADDLQKAADAAADVGDRAANVAWTVAWTVAWAAAWDAAWAAAEAARAAAWAAAEAGQVAARATQAVRFRAALLAHESATDD